MKCKMCDGLGYIGTPAYVAGGEIIGMDGVECRDCEGTGRVWGLEFEYQGQPVRITIPRSADVQVGDVWEIERVESLCGNGFIFRNTRNGVEFPLREMPK